MGRCIRLKSQWRCQTTVSRYYPDKAELKQTLKTMFIHMKETVHTQGLLEICDRIIDQYDSWTGYV